MFFNLLLCFVKLDKMRLFLVDNTLRIFDGLVGLIVHLPSYYKTWISFELKFDSIDRNTRGMGFPPKDTIVWHGRTELKISRFTDVNLTLPSLTKKTKSCRKVIERETG
jgi:hypothetical protein